MLRAALALATAASAAAATTPGGVAPDAPQSGFGAPVAVHLAHVGHIEVALGPGGATGLRQVRCAAPAAPTTSCYVGR